SRSSSTDGRQWTRASNAPLQLCSNGPHATTIERCCSARSFTYPSPDDRMISLTHISKQYGRQILFVDASFQLNPGEKVGLVGPNGSGKTTLFRFIAAEEVPDEGEVSIPKKLTVGYFRQDVEEMSGRSVLDEAILG